MRRAPLLASALALAVLGGALLPVTATAQLKPKLPGKINRVLGGGGDQPSAVPKFNERTIEISERHVTAVLAGLRMQNDSLAARWAAYTAAKKMYDDSTRAYPALQKDYEQRHAAWEACQDREVKPVQASAEANAQQAMNQMTGGDQAAFEQAMEKVAERIKAAQQRGDMQEVMRLADSVQKASMKANAAVMEDSEKLQAAAGKCGHEPEEPRSPHEPVYDRTVLPIPRNGALWSDDEQYAIMMDRLEPLLAMEKQGDFDRALQTAFSEAEQQAITPHAQALRAEMARRRTLLENG